MTSVEPVRESGFFDCELCEDTYTTLEGAEECSDYDRVALKYDEGD